MPTDTTKPKDPVVVEAIAKAGGASALAEALGISRMAVGKWRRIPPARVLDVARLTRIAKARLRPDLFGPPPEPPHGATAKGAGR